MGTKRLTARQMMRHAVAVEDSELVAMLLVAGGLETLERLQARKAMPVAERFGVFSKLLAGVTEGQPVGATVEA